MLHSCNSNILTSSYLRWYASHRKLSVLSQTKPLQNEITAVVLPAVWVTKPISTILWCSQFFWIIKILDTYWMTHLYLTDVQTAKLQQQLLNRNVPQIDGLVQERRSNSITYALELHLSCTKPSKWRKMSLCNIRNIPNGEMNTQSWIIPHPWSVGAYKHPEIFKQFSR